MVAILVVNKFSAAIALLTSAVKLALVELILELNATSSVVALVTSAVKLAFVEFILVFNAASSEVALVTSAVKLALVVAILVVKTFSAAVALVTSAVKLELVELILVFKAASSKVALVISAVKLAFVDAIFVVNTFSAEVALLISAVKLVLVVLILVVKTFSAAVALVTSAVKFVLVVFILVDKPFSAPVALFTSALILFDNDAVSFANLLDNIAAVSNKLNFPSAAVPTISLKLLICLLTNKVVAIVLSATVESCVTVMGLPVKVGDDNVLFENVSVPANVAKVPDVGKIILLAAVVVMVKSPIPFVIMLFAIEIVLPLLFKPVPPFSLGIITAPMDKAESATLALVANKVYGTLQNCEVPKSTYSLSGDQFGLGMVGAIATFKFK